MSAFFHSLPGRPTSTISGRLHGGSRHNSPPPARSTVYGPSVKRIPVEISSEALLAGSGSSSRGIRALNDGSSDSEEDGAEGDGDGAVGRVGHGESGEEGGGAGGKQGGGGREGKRPRTMKKEYR